jgi:hypothetical protein
VLVAIAPKTAIDKSCREGGSGNMTNGYYSSVTPIPWTHSGGKTDENRALASRLRLRGRQKPISYAKPPERIASEMVVVQTPLSPPGTEPRDNSARHHRLATVDVLAERTVIRNVAISGHCCSTMCPSRKRPVLAERRARKLRCDMPFALGGKNELREHCVATAVEKEPERAVKG